LEFFFQDEPCGGIRSSLYLKFSPLASKLREDKEVALVSKAKKRNNLFMNLNFTLARSWNGLPFSIFKNACLFNYYKVCLVSDPRPDNPTGQTYTVDCLGNVVGGRKTIYNNQVKNPT